jgi:restriction endonuclease S subunit
MRTFVVVILKYILKIKLEHIATIQTGIFAKPVSKGKVVYLQVKYFDEHGQLQSTLHPDLEYDNISEKHLLKPNDVLFAAKGTKNFAAWYESENMPAVASTSFFVIRIQNNFQTKILPEYLVWFINHPISQSFLKANAIGSSIASISKVVLEKLEISIPDVQTQKNILKISHLRDKEKNLKKLIETLREKQIQAMLIQAVSQ